MRRGRLSGRAVAAVVAWGVMASVAVVALSSGAQAATSDSDPAPVGGAVRKGDPVEPGTGAPAAAIAESSEGPTTPVLDDFNRPDGPLGASWDLITTQGTLGVRSNVVKKTSGGLGVYYWTPDTFPADQEAHAVSAGVGCCVEFHQSVRLYLRIQSVAPEAFDGYELINHFASAGNRWYIRSYVDGTFTDLAIVGTDRIGRMLFRAVGTTLEGWGSNDGGATWFLVIQATDSTYTGGGRVGFAVENNTPSADDFGAGTVEAGGGTERLAVGCGGTRWAR